MQGMHSYLSASLAVVVGTTIAFIYTAFHKHLSTQNEIIREYLEDLATIERLSEQYWLKTVTCFQDKQQHDVIGHELRARIEATSNYDELSQQVLGNLYTRFQELDVCLFMQATGGKFQTSEFQPCPETYGAIMNTISEIRDLLRKKRRSLFWSS